MALSNVSRFEGGISLFSKIHPLDDFLKPIISYGLKLPLDCCEPSALRNDQILPYIESQFTPFTHKHYMLIQFLEERGKEWIEREHIPFPEMIKPSYIIADWEINSSEAHRAFYFEKYKSYLGLNTTKEQLSFAEGLIEKVLDPKKFELN